MGWECEQTHHSHRRYIIQRFKHCYHTQSVLNDSRVNALAAACALGGMTIDSTTKYRGIHRCKTCHNERYISRVNLLFLKRMIRTKLLCIKYAWQLLFLVLVSGLDIPHRWE